MLLLLSPPPGVGVPRGALWCVLGWRGCPHPSERDAVGLKTGGLEQEDHYEGDLGGLYNLKQAVDWVQVGRLERMQATSKRSVSREGA